MSDVRWLIAVATLAVGALALKWIAKRSRSRCPAVRLDDVVALDASSEWNALDLPDRFVEIEGRKLRYVETGEGPPLLLVHGIGASLHAWRFVLRPLSKAHRAIALDLPGFGKSDAPADSDFSLDAQSRRAFKVLDALGIDQAGLVGSSMGGAIALWMQKLDAGRAPKVAALAPAIDPRLVPRGLRRFRRAGRAFGRALGPRSMRLILGRVVTRRQLLDASSVGPYLSPYLERREPLDAFWAGLDLLSDPRLPQELAAPVGSVLVLYGERDRMIPRRYIDRYLKLAPGAEFLAHANAGHHLMEDEPSWTAGALLRFFRPT